MYVLTLHVFHELLAITKMGVENSLLVLLLVVNTCCSRGGNITSERP